MATDRVGRFRLGTFFALSSVCFFYCSSSPPLPTIPRLCWWDHPLVPAPALHPNYTGYSLCSSNLEKNNWVPLTLRLYPPLPHYDTTEHLSYLPEPPFPGLISLVQALHSNATEFLPHSLIPWTLRDQHRPFDPPSLHVLLTWEKTIESL